MYGWRARIGITSAGRGDTFMYEFYKIVPEGVVVVFGSGTGSILQLTQEYIDKAIANIEESVTDLARVGVDYIFILGHPRYTSQGVGSDIRAIQMFEKKFGIPVNTAITAEVEALRHMKIRKVAIVTPHGEYINNMLSKFITQSGFEVATIKGMNILENRMAAAQPDYEAYRLAKSVHRECPDVDGIYIQCPRLPTIYQVERIESETGLPVITSPLAYIWAAFKRLGIKEHASGFGRLLDTLGE